VIPIIIVALLGGLLAAGVALRFPGSDEARAVGMMVVGAAMIGVSVVFMIAGDEPAPTTLGIIGLVSLGVGARRRRASRRS
jgi:hypothetical protein